VNWRDAGRHRPMFPRWACCGTQRREEECRGGYWLRVELLEFASLSVPSAPCCRGWSHPGRLAQALEAPRPSEDHLRRRSARCWSHGNAPSAAAALLAAGRTPQSSLALDRGCQTCCNGHCCA